MVDHVRRLLENQPTGDGYVHVTDGPSDVAMSLFGVTPETADLIVPLVVPLALAPDLAWARDSFDPRVTPQAEDPVSVYRTEYEATDGEGRPVSLSLDGLHDRVLGQEGWWRIADLFSHPDPTVRQHLSDLREAARSMDSAYALGAVLLACAYRRSLLQGDESVKLKGLAP